MKNFIPKLVVLADNLDRLGLKKDADKIDLLIARAARRGDDEDFDTLTKLFDEPIELEDREDEAPGRRMFVPDEDNAEALSTEPDEPVGSGVSKDPKKDRLKELIRRHQLLKLKKEMGLPSEPVVVEDDEDTDMDDESVDEVKLPVASPEDLEGFEDEDDENEADDSLIDELKEKLKGVPELAKQLLTIVKDNPELLELLAL